MPSPEQLQAMSALLPRAFSEKDKAAQKSADRLMAAFRDKLPEPKVEDNPEELKRRMKEYLAKNP